VIVPDDSTKPFSASHMTFSFHAAARLSAACFILMQAGCNSDGGIDRVVDPAVATSLTSNTIGTLTAGAGFGVQPPSVTVKDQRGAVMPGVAVTFVVSGGDGTVTGGSTATNSAGVAAPVSWVLGATPGMNTLTASVATLPSITFAAIGLENPPVPCVQVIHGYEFGGTVTGALNSDDCLSDAVFSDLYSATLSDAGAFLFKVSATFDAVLYLHTAQIFNAGFIAYNDDESHTSTNPAIKAFLPRGPYVLAVSSVKWGDTGTYSLSSSTTSPDITDCEEVYSTRGVSLTQHIQTTDCLRASGPFYADQLIVYLEAGQTVNLSMVSAELDSFVEILREDPATGARTVVASNDNETSDTKDAGLSYTTTTAANYVIRASTAVGGQTGTYTLGIHR
jgi:hypothetical protein